MDMDMILVRLRGEARVGMRTQTRQALESTVAVSAAVRPCR